MFLFINKLETKFRLNFLQNSFTKCIFLYNYIAKQYIRNI